MQKNKKKTLMYDDSWMYTLLLSTVVILGESLKNYSFELFGVTLTYTIFILPVMYLLVNYITKKYDYKRAISAICISTAALVAYTYGISYSVGRAVSILDIAGEMAGYLLSQLVNLHIYLFMLNNSRSPRLLVWINYMFSLVLFYMIYTLMNLNVLVTETYWIGYFTTIFIQGIESIIFTIIDKFIRRGIEE